MRTFVFQSLVFVFAFLCMGCTTLDMLKATQIARKAAQAACQAEPLLAGFSGFAIGAVETSSTTRGLTITSTQTRLIITVEAK